VYSLHQSAQAGTRSAAVLVGSGHIVPPQSAQSGSMQVSFVHHAAQPDAEGTHFALLQFSQPSASQVSSSHHTAQPVSSAMPPEGSGHIVLPQD